MGGTSSVPYDVAKQQVVSEKVREVMKKFGGIYKKQYGVEILNAVQFELDSREVQPQLLQRKIPLNKTTKSLWEGFAYRHLTNSRSWKEQYLVITGDYFIACYPNKQEFKNGGSPSYVIDCTGCILLSSLEHYQSVSRISPAQAGKVSSSPMLHCPTPYPLYLWHSYRLHEYLCAKSLDGQTSWKAVIRDCTRNLESGLSSELESKTLLGAVRAYRQTQQKYGAWEMLSGTEIEVLSNLIMEEALPAVQTDILKKISRKSPEKETAWNGVTDCMYKQVQQEVEQKYRMLLRNCQESKLQIEALARSEYNDIKRCRKDLHLKLQAWIGPNTNKFLQNNVHPYQPSLLESIVEPVSEGFSDIRSMFVTGSSEIIKSTENGTSQEQIGQMISKLKLLPYNPMAMHPCYDKVETMRENHERLKERFHFSGIKSLVKETQRRMKQILDNAIYTFEQLTHHSMSNCQNSKELASRLQKAQNRVLKKFDYDSSSCRKKLFHESLVQITFPFVLSKLKPACREGLPEFEEEILTEYSSVLKLSNNFEEAVLELISPDICEAIHDVTSQNKHSLLRDSVIQLADSEPNLLSRLAEQPSPWNAARFSSYMPVAEPEGSLPDILDSLKHKQQGGEDNSSKATLPVEGTSETRGDHNSARRSSYGEDPTVNCIGEPVQMRKQKHEAVPGHVVSERISGDVKEILEAMTVKQMPADDPEVGIAGAGEPVQLRKQKHEAPSGHLLSDIASGDANEILETMTVKQIPPADPEVGIAGAGEPVQLRKQKHEAPPGHLLSDIASGDANEILETMTIKQIPPADPEVGIAGAGEPVQMRKQKHEAPSGHLLSDIASGDANEILETMTVKQIPPADPEVGIADIRAKPGDLQVETEYVDEQDE